MSKTEHRIAYKAGITRSPSDFLCEDGELAECINLTTDNEELKVVTPPEVFINSVSYFGVSVPMEKITMQLLYVHKTNSEQRFIVGFADTPSADTLSMAFGIKEGTNINISGYISHDIDKNIKITSVGNILILNDGKTMSYFLWKADEGYYKSMGDHIPEPKIEFAMVKDKTVFMEKGDNNGSIDVHQMGNVFAILIKEGKQDEYNDLVLGLYAKVLNDIAVAKHFAKPFFVRCALELYDGSFTCLSAPVVLFPAIHYNCRANANANDGSINVLVDGLPMFFKPMFDYTEWSDLVKNVVVFVSEGTNLYDISGDQVLKLNQNLPYHDYIAAEATISSANRVTGLTDHSSTYHSSTNSAANGFQPLKSRNASEIQDDLSSTSVFYKLFEAGLTGGGEWEDSRSYIKSHTIENLTTQEQLTSDDYFSRCPIVSEFMASYNSRLMLAGVKRGFFEGFDTFLPYDNSREYTYDIYVYIKTPSGTRVVKKQLSTYEKMGIYFFYPDARAERAVVFSEKVLVCDMKLKEHPYLNGAYYWAGLPDGSESDGINGINGISWDECEAAVDVRPEELSNQIYQSEVNNPYVFGYKGNKTVGNGKILAMATLTTALSQGQFGQHPVIVFTTEGIWAMAVDNEGYIQPAQPMSREVCINAKTVLETDGAVFFASKKGLMVVVGNQVKCMTEQMNGVTCNTDTVGDPVGTDTDWRNIISKCAGSDSFLQYIRDENCFLAYDYIDSRLLIVNPSYEFSYLYSIADGNVSKVIMPGKIMRAVNYYPDYLLQDENGVVYSLYSKKDETEIGERQLAFLLTRPMKLTGPLSVSSLRELVNVGYWDKKSGSSVKTEVFVSDNLVDWYDMESRFGAAAKYFRIALYINIYPTERLSGTIIRDQERRSNNAR